MTIKNALILHGTGNDSSGNWFPWLKTELQHRGYKVWVPDLPDANNPNIKRYNAFILKNKQWEFNSDSVLIGHSSGSVAILGLLQHLPKATVVDTCILVGSFVASAKDKDWEQMNGLFEEPFDFEKIKKHAKRFVFVHSDDDPYCPLEQAQYLSDHVGGEFILKHNQGHFNLEKGPEYTQFPLILEILGENK